MSYLTVAVYVLKPSYQQINQLIARQVKLLFVDGIDIGREHLTIVDALNAKVRDDGMKIYNQQQAREAGIEQATYYGFWSSQMSEYLGGEAEVRVTHGLNIPWVCRIFFNQTAQAGYLYVNRALQRRIITAAGKVHQFIPR